MATQNKAGAAGQAAALPTPTVLTDMQAQPFVVKAPMVQRAGSLGSGLDTLLPALVARAGSKLTADELAQLRCLDEPAQALVCQLAMTAEGISELLANDGANGPASGALQSKDEVSGLLNALSVLAKQAAGMLAVSDLACTLLEQRGGQS